MIDNAAGNDRLFPQLTARDLALILFKRKWSIMAVVAATMIACLTWLFLIRDDNYRVAVKVLVKIGREQAPPPSVMGTPPMVVAYRSQDVNSEIDIFQSAESVVRVVDELHLDQPLPEAVPSGFFPRFKYEVKRLSRWVKDWYEETLIRVGLRERLSPREKAIFSVQRALRVQAQKDSNVFVAELVLPYRQTSARILNALLDRYLSYRQELFQNKETDFFQSTLDETAAKLHEAEARLQRFENEGGITEITKQESVLLEQIAAARVAWKQIDYRREELLGRVQRLEAELRKDDPNFAAVGEFAEEGFLQTVLTQMAELQRQREELRMTELDSGDKVQSNRQQLRVLAEMLTANLRTSLAEKEQQTTLRRSTYVLLEEQLRRVHEKQMELAGLTRRVKDYEDSHSLFRKKLEEAAADDAMLQKRVSNAVVIERAMDPVAPVGLRKTTLLMLALLGAVLAALSWVSVAELFDQRVYTADELQQHVSGPVMAEISEGVRLQRKGQLLDSDGNPLAAHGH